MAADPQPAASDSVVASPIAPRRYRRFRQFTLRTLLLLTAAIAVWTLYFTNRRHIGLLEARVKVMWPMTHELIVNDPQRIAVVKLDQLWHDENIWKVYLPEGRYRLCVATRDVDQQGSAPVVKSVALDPGQHQLALQQRAEGSVLPVWRVAVICNEAEVISVEEPAEWDPGKGSVGGGLFSECTQLPVDEQVVLLRRRFSRPNSAGQSSTPAGPTEGILLWIEREADTHTAP